MLGCEIVLFFSSIPLTLLLLQAQHNLTNHLLHKYPPCAFFHHLVKPQFHHLWRFLSIFSWLEGINIECDAPFLSWACAWLAWLSPAMEHWSEADTWMHATKFFSKMQAHCIFELAPAHFHIEMALSSYLLHKISKDCCLPSPWWGCRARGRRDGCESRDEPGEAAGAAQGPGLSAECGWAVVTFGVPWLSHAGGQSSGITMWPFPGESFLSWRVCGSLLYSGLEKRGILPSVYSKGVNLWLLPVKHFAQHNAICIVRC